MPRRLAAGASLAAALFAVGCGSDDESSTSATSTSPAATTQAGAARSPPPHPGIVAVARLPPPAGSTQLSSSATDRVVHSLHETDATPEEVVAAYRRALAAAGWSVLTVSPASGSWGGDWGRFRSSGIGVTGRRGRVYVTVQAGERSGKTYFEVCAGSGTREACDRFSEEARTS